MLFIMGFLRLSLAACLYLDSISKLLNDIDRPCDDI